MHSWTRLKAMNLVHSASVLSEVIASKRSLTEMLTIHPQPTTRTLQVPPELLYKVTTWVLAQSVHSICVLADDEVEWELKLVETLCLVSSAFREITIEVACKAFRIQREESNGNYPR